MTIHLDMAPWAVSPHHYWTHKVRQESGRRPSGLATRQPGPLYAVAVHLYRIAGLVSMRLRPG